MILNLNILSVKSGLANIGTQFLTIFECLSLYCKGHISVSLVWVFALCVVPANRKRWRPSCPVTSVSYPGRVRPMRLLLQWQLWAASCPRSKACHHSSLAWGIPCMVRKCSSANQSVKYPSDVLYGVNELYLQSLYHHYLSLKHLMVTLAFLNGIFPFFMECETVSQVVVAYLHIWWVIIKAYFLYLLFIILLWCLRTWSKIYFM